MKVTPKWLSALALTAVLGCDSGSSSDPGSACAGVTCLASDQCHRAGTCDPSTGVCSNPPQPDSTGCDDGDACTQADTCRVGICVGADRIVCSPADPPRVCDGSSGAAVCVPRPPIHIAFHWDMYQPIFWPYESIVATQTAGRLGFSVYAIHTDRSGPYGAWPGDAISAGLGQPHLGAQVSFSGSLMENLGGMASAGAFSSGWRAPWSEATGWTTAGDNPRLDLVAQGYHHPLMPLLDSADARLQIQIQREAATEAFGAHQTRGFFPAACAFSERMIPWLVAEGVQWTYVDSAHLERAHLDFSYSPASGLPHPNAADQQNPQATSWVQLTNLWAPAPVAAPWAYRPHWVEHVDPESGEVSRMIAVPAARYEGAEDARGGFGALQYETVMSQLEALNDDPAHPILVVLLHAGDAYGGGTDSYYHQNFQSFVTWVAANPSRFQATTVQDYLDRFPPAQEDVAHVEGGSWMAAEGGAPTFDTWIGAPGGDGYSPDRNSWAVITAARNRVLTAESISPHSGTAAVLHGTGNDTDKAWHYLLDAEASFYWEWDGGDGGLWDAHPTRGANQAVSLADAVIAGNDDHVGPTVFLPQREPYNPGIDSPPTFTVWTYADDVSGLSEVSLRIRADDQGVRSSARERYDDGAWTSLPMKAQATTSRTDPQPLHRATLYSADVVAMGGTLIDYYVYARDGVGNEARSPIQHVYVAVPAGLR